MQARIKRIATEAEVKASSIRSHKNAEGEIFVGKWCVIYEGGRINMNFLEKCTPREMAIARYWGLFYIPAIMDFLEMDGQVDIINRIFDMTDLFALEPDMRKEVRRMAKKNKDRKTAPPIDPPLKPLGEWIPPKTTLWQKIRGWFGNDAESMESLRADLEKTSALAKKHYEDKLKAERAFIAIARPRYTNNSLSKLDAVYYVGLCGWHGEDLTDEVPF